MPNRGIQSFYYSRTLPPKAVAIASLSAQPYTPAQLTDINNTPYLPASLGIWKDTSSLSGAADFTAPDLNVAVTISGTSNYYVNNQFFELTPVAADDGTALFYIHNVPANITNVKILDLAGNVQTATWKIIGQNLYHSMDGGAYKIRYVDSRGIPITELLEYNQAMFQGVYSPSATSYLMAGKNITVASVGTLYIRFTQPSGYIVSSPYGGPSNVPWFPRVRFSPSAVAQEWARQPFTPVRPYLLATWVPGKVLSSSVLEFERKQVYDDPTRLPDVLIFDKDFAVKHALEGSSLGTPRRRGSIYNWKRGLIKALDPGQARVEVGVDLDPTDQCFAFYSYKELDIIYRDIDVNPFTNPSIKNRVVVFYYRTNSDPFRSVYHQVIESNGTFVAGMTNDPSPLTDFTSVHVFSELIVGGGVSVSEFAVSDERVRGGGLQPASQDIPESVNFWDIGYLDGKPYPASGVLVLHLPVSILDTMTKDEVEQRVTAILPVGALPVIFYYDASGVETR